MQANGGGDEATTNESLLSSTKSPYLVDTSSEGQSHISMDETFGDDTVTRAQGVVVFDFGKGSGWEITKISVVINLRSSKTTHQLSRFHNCHLYNLDFTAEHRLESSNSHSL